MKRLQWVVAFVTLLGGVVLVAQNPVTVSKVGSTNVDTNSGNKSAGTMRVVIATDQPALTNKLLVTPDSIALPANQSVNESQINGVTVLMGNGASGTGAQRVTIASDSTGQITIADSGGTNITNTTAHALKTFPVDSTTGTALVAPSSSNGTVDSGTYRVAIASNNSPVAGMGVGATGSAPPANGVFNAGLGSGATGGLLTGIAVCDAAKGVNVSTATTTLMVAGVSGRQVRVCGLSLLAAGADNVQFISGTGATCGTGTSGIGGGGTSAGSGWNFAANGGLTQGSGLGVLFTTTATGDSLCLVTSAGVQLSGILTYVIY